MIAFYCKTVEGVCSRWLMSHHTYNPSVQQISTSLPQLKLQDWTMLSLRLVDDTIINQRYSYSLMLSMYCSPVKLWYHWISPSLRVVVNQVLIESVISQVKKYIRPFYFAVESVAQWQRVQTTIAEVLLYKYLKNICKSHIFSTWWQSWAEDQSYSSWCLCTWKGSPSPEISSNLINSTLLAILSFRGQDKSI